MALTIKVKEGVKVMLEPMRVTHARISSNTPISLVYKYNFPLLNKHCWRYIIKLIGYVKMDSFARLLILLGPGTSYLIIFLLIDWPLFTVA